MTDAALERHSAGLGPRCCRACFPQALWSRRRRRPPLCRPMSEPLPCLGILQAEAGRGVPLRGVRGDGVSQPEMTFRHSLMWRMHDFSQGRGLEIGPLHNATVPRGMGDVRYVDVLPREGLVEHYRDDDRVPTELIPEIDFVLSTDDGFQTLQEAAAPGAPYDWATASHVIEHTPDVITWLAEIGDLVVDGGKLILAVPD